MKSLRELHGRSINFVVMVRNCLIATSLAGAGNKCDMAGATCGT